MISRILVPLDGSRQSEQVLPYVRILARGSRAPVVLVQAVPDSGAGARPPGEDRGERPDDAPGREAWSYLEGVAASLGGEGLEVSHAVIAGEPASAIAGEARREPDTLIAMSSRGRGGVTRWVAGSVTDQVLQSTATPLLIVRSQEPGAASDPDARLNHLIVPLDGSELAERVLPLAVGLARGLGLRMTLLRVTPAAEDYHHSPEYPPLSTFDDLAREVDEEAEDYLRHVAQRLLGQGVPAVEERLLHGSPGAAIIDYVQEVPDSLTALTTRGRSGIGRLLLGSVADQLARDSGGPVLLVRGEG